MHYHAMNVIASLAPEKFTLFPPLYGQPYNTLKLSFYIEQRDIQ